MADNGALHTYNYVLVTCHRALQKANLLGIEANAIYVKGCNYWQLKFASTERWAWQFEFDILIVETIRRVRTTSENRIET